MYVWKSQKHSLLVLLFLSIFCFIFIMKLGIKLHPRRQQVEESKSEALDLRTRTRKCNTTSFLTVGVGGRLGNQMGEYATLLSHSLRLKMIPFIPKHQKIMLSAIFRWGFCTIMPFINLLLEALFSHIPIQTWEELEEQGISLQNHSRELVHEWVLRNQATPSREATSCTRSYCGRCVNSFHVDISGSFI